MCVEHLKTRKKNICVLQFHWLQTSDKNKEMTNAIKHPPLKSNTCPQKILELAAVTKRKLIAMCLSYSSS